MTTEASAWQRCRSVCLRVWADLFDDDGLDALFQYARNVLSGALIVAAGLYATHHRPLSPQPALWTVQFAGNAITVLGVVMLLLNLIGGLRRLSRRNYPRVLHAIVTVATLGLTLRLVQVLAYFRHAY